MLKIINVCDPMCCSMPAFPVLHCPLEIAQTHVHWVNDCKELYFLTYVYFNSNYKCTFSLLESSIWKGINYIGIQNLPNSQIEIFYFLHFSIHGICLLELKHNRKESDWATLYNANQECFPEVQGAFLRQILYHVKMGEIIPMI